MVNHLKSEDNFLCNASYRVVLVCDNVHLSNTVSSKEFNLLKLLKIMMDLVIAVMLTARLLLLILISSTSGNPVVLKIPGLVTICRLRSMRLCEQVT